MIEKKECEWCHEEKPLADFRGQKWEFIWCKECRSLNPKEAKRVQDARVKRMQYTPEAGRMHHEVYKKAHPERLKWRSEQELQRVAASMALDGLEHAKKLARGQCKELGYTRGQIQKVVDLLGQYAQIFKVEE